MSIIGWLIFALSLYLCGFQATYILVSTLPDIHKNHWVFKHSSLMCFLFPFSLFLNIAPEGYRCYYFACFIMLTGSLPTWILWAVAFIFLPLSWWCLFVLIAITFLAGLFVPQDMIDVMDSVGGPIVLKVLKK